LQRSLDPEIVSGSKNGENRKIFDRINFRFPTAKTALGGSHPDKALDLKLSAMQDLSIPVD
jgi:hypothetical protein